MAEILAGTFPASGDAQGARGRATPTLFEMDSRETHVSLLIRRIHRTTKVEGSVDSLWGKISMGVHASAAEADSPEPSTTSHPRCLRQQESLTIKSMGPLRKCGR